jgi:hypothetical protein
MIVAHSQRHVSRFEFFEQSIIVEGLPRKWRIGLFL